MPAKAVEKESTLKEGEESQPVVVRPEPEKELLSWNGPARPFKRRDKQFYVTTVAIAGLFGLVMFLVDGFLPVILIISIVFLFYVLSTVEPENIEYKITSKGIKIAGRETPWGAARRFWFSKRFGVELLVIEIDSFPGRIEVVVPEEKKEEAKEKIVKYLRHEELPPSSLDKLANWFGKKLPGLG